LGGDVSGLWVSALGATYRVWTLSVALAAVAVNPFAADAGDLPTSPAAVTLAASKQIAFARNWDLLAAKSDIALGMAEEIVAREFPNPTLALSTSKIPVDGKSAGTRSGNDLWDRSYDTVAALNQLFEIGGKRASRQASGRAGTEIAKAQFADARRLLDEAVAKAYVTAAAAESNGRILGESAASLRKEAQIAAMRFRAGDISRADEGRLAVAADRLDVQAEQAKTTAVTARIALEVLLAVAEPKGDVVLADSLEQLAQSPPPVNLDALPRARADLLAAQASVDKATADLQLQRALRIPDPTVTTQYEHEPPDQPNTIGVGVSFPLPLWNWNRGAILAALAARERAETQLAKVRAQTASDAAAARRTYEEAVTRWRRHQTEIQPRSAAILEAVEFAYKRGAASLVDLLAAERDDNDVRLATVQAAADVATGAASLRSAFGVTDAIEVSP